MISNTYKAAGYPSFAPTDKINRFNITKDSVSYGKTIGEGGYVSLTADFRTKNLGSSYAKDFFGTKTENSGLLFSRPISDADLAIRRQSVTYSEKDEAKIQAARALGDAVIFNAHTGGQTDKHYEGARGYAQIGTNSGIGTAYENDNMVADLTLLGGKGGFMPRVTVGMKMDDGIVRSTQDLNFTPKLGFPDLISADVDWTSNGKTFSFTVSANPIVLVGSLITGIVKYFTSDREGAFYESIDPDTKPMKGVYGSEKLFEGSPPKLTEHGEKIAKVIQNDLKANKDATMYIGQYKQKGLKKEEQELAQQAMLEAITGGDEALAKRISIGHPPKDVSNQELIRANYANVVIANPKLFRGTQNNAFFMGLNSTEGLKQQKEIEKSPLFKQLTEDKGRDEKEALLNYTMSRLALLRGKGYSNTAEDILSDAKANLYDKGLTLLEMTRIEKPEDVIQNLAQRKDVQEFFTANKITDKEDQTRIANYIYNLDKASLEQVRNGGTAQTMPQLLQIAKSEMIDKGVSNKNIAQLDNLIEQRLEQMAKNPQNEYENLIGQSFKQANGDNEKYMVSVMRSSYLKNNDSLVGLSAESVKATPLDAVGAISVVATKNKQTPIEAGRYVDYGSMMARGNPNEAVRAFNNNGSTSLKDEKKMYVERAQEEVKALNLSPSDAKQAQTAKVNELIAGDLKRAFNDYSEALQAIRNSDKLDKILAQNESAPKQQQATPPVVDVAAMEKNSIKQQKPEPVVVVSQTPEIKVDNSQSLSGMAPA